MHQSTPFLKKGSGQWREREGGCRSMHQSTFFLKKVAEGGREREVADQWVSQLPF